MLFASQTGNADSISEDLLETINEDGDNKGYFKGIKRYDLNSPKFNLEEKKTLKLLVFVVSSTGNGDMPENGEKFYRMLRRKSNLLAEGQKSEALSHVYYTILGLGSSDYSKYQAVPRYIDQKLTALGAKKYYYKGEADDGTSLELVVEPWLEGI